MASFTRRLVVAAAIALSHVTSLSNSRVCRPNARPLQLSTYRSYGNSRFRFQPFRSNRRPDDFIEAEIVSQTDRDPKKDREQNNQNIEILNRRKEKIPEKEKSESGGVFNRLATFFGQDEESIKKRERKKQLNSAIDKVFEGSGVLGTVIGSLAKGVGGMLAESMYAASADLEVIQQSVLSKLEADGDCVSALGGTINLSPPFTSSSSSSNINGTVRKEYFYIFQASGNRGEGQVQVRASMDGTNKVTVQELILRTNTGQVINVGGGTSGGGGRGGGGGGAGRVIDVDAKVQ